jgi:hypothetical protein
MTMESGKTGTESRGEVVRCFLGTLPGCSTDWGGGFMVPTPLRGWEHLEGQIMAMQQAVGVTVRVLRLGTFTHPWYIILRDDRKSNWDDEGRPAFKHSILNRLHEMLGFLWQLAVRPRQMTEDPLNSNCYKLSPTKRSTPGAAASVEWIEVLQRDWKLTKLTTSFALVYYGTPVMTR